MALYFQHMLIIIIDLLRQYIKLFIFYVYVSMFKIVHYINTIQFIRVQVEGRNVLHHHCDS